MTYRLAWAIGLLAVAMVSINPSDVRAQEKKPQYGKTPALSGTQRLHVASEGKHYAAVRKDGENYLVVIDDAEFGPFTDTDVLGQSPFLGSTGNWSFRAQTPDGVALVLKGKQYGPYQEVWDVVHSGNHWGCLVKKADRYHVLVDGKESKGHEFFLGNHLNETFDLHSHLATPDIPLFYGKNGWAGFARNEGEYSIVTDQQTAGPYSAIDRHLADAGESSIVDLRGYLCFDRSTLAVPISKKADGTETFHLWINGKEVGPFSQPTDFRAASMMSINGQAWAFSSDHAIHSNEGTVERAMVSSPELSDNGKTLVYSFGPDGERRFVVNGKQYGPFNQVFVVDVSPDGKRWLAAVKPSADNTEWYVHTESGQQGPFPGIVSAGFHGNEAMFAVAVAPEELQVVVDGKELGRFRNFQIEGQPTDRVLDKSWRALGFLADKRVEVYDRNHKLATVGPYDSFSIPRVKAPHWSGLGNNAGKLQLVESGERSEEFGPFAQLLTHVRTPDARRLAVVVRNADAKQFVLLRDGQHGPYDAFPAGFSFSEDGKHWGFRFGKEETGFKVVHDQGESPAYRRIEDFQVTAHGAAFVGCGDEGCYIHIGDKRHGPFEAAGLSADAKQIKAATIKDGKLSWTSH